MEVVDLAHALTSLAVHLQALTVVDPNLDGALKAASVGGTESSGTGWGQYSDNPHRTLTKNPWKCP